MRREMYTYNEEPSLGKRLGRFAALLVIVFGVAAGVVVAQRLSDDALGVIIGMILVGVPLLAIVGVLLFIILRRESRQATQSQPPQPQPLGGMVMPPIIMQIPQQPQLPDYGYEAPAQRGKSRAWDLIGEE